MMSDELVGLGTGDVYSRIHTLDALVGLGDVPAGQSPGKGWCRMSILDVCYEVWIPMPNQDPALPAGQRRYYLDASFTDQDDAMAALRDASGGAVTKTTYASGVRTVVVRP